MLNIYLFWMSSATTRRGRRVRTAFPLVWSRKAQKLRTAASSFPAIAEDDFAWIDRCAEPNFDGVHFEETRPF